MKTIPGMKFVKFIRFILLLLLIIFFLAVTFLQKEDSRYYPCRNVPTEMWQDCVDEYMSQGWTYDNILNGIVLDEKK